MTWIHLFWLVACAVAERIAISPLPPMVLDAICSCLRPISSGLDGLIWNTRPALAIPESNDSTVMPRCAAFLQAGIRASGSLAEITIAFTFWAISELIISIWPSAVGVVGPV